MSRRFAGATLMAVLGFAACATEAPSDPAPPVTSATSLDAAAAVAVRVRLELPATSGGAVRLVDRKSGVAMGVRLVGSADVEAVVRDGAVVYPAAAPGGGDWTHRPSPDGDEDHVALPGRPAAPEVAYELELGAAVAGLRLVDRVLELLDASGAPRLRVGRAAIVGADGRRSLAQPRVDGCAVDTSPRAPWGRTPVPPGARRCLLRIAWSDDVAHPAVLDPPWTATGAMTEPRRLFVMTTLASGLVLAAGGLFTDAADSAELYDPATGTWAVTGGMSAKRANLHAAILPQGRVLVGGGSFGATLASSEIYDEATGTFGPTGSMAAARVNAVFVTLSTGEVLATGGSNQAASFLSSAELFDPASGTWTNTTGLALARSAHGAVLLGDGSVLVMGGQPSAAGASAERYDPVLGVWSPVADMSHEHEHPVALRLDSGAAIVISGFPCCGTPAEIFDPVSGAWSDTADMLAERVDHTGVVMANGRILVAGGVDASTLPTAATEIYDPIAGSWSTAGSLVTARRWAQAALLGDGSVLVAGGEDLNGAHLDTVERFGGLALGAPCALDAECVDGVCVDGVCCDGPCDGTCEACDASGACTPVPAGSDPDHECTDSGSPACLSDGACDGQGACEIYPTSSGCAPEPCSDPSDCASGHCVDGICCDSACDGPCEACTGVLSGGVDGVCTPVGKGTDPDDDCAGPTGAACADVSLCDGAGECAPAEDVCAPYVCAGPEGCLQGCSGDDQCAGGAVCHEGDCTTDLSGCVGDDARTSDGTLVACAPYRCDPASATCRSTCRSVDDCVAPNLCDTSGHCAPAPAPTPASGCGCRAVGAPLGGAAGPLAPSPEPGRRGWPAIALLGLAIAAARRLPRYGR